MKPSKYQLRRKAELVKKAQKLYKQGLSTREIAPLIDRSHAWVALAVKETAPVDK